MKSRAEITRRYATAYAKASRKGKSLILDQVVDVTGWSRDNARRRLSARAADPPGGHRVKPGPKPGSRRYSYDTLKVLQQVWAASGGQCGKYLVVAMRDVLANLEAHGRLAIGEGRYTVEVKDELVRMSAATIDRYLAPTRAQGPIRGKTGAKPTSLLRTSISVRRAGDQAEGEPGFFEVDTVAHCGPTLKGEFARSVDFTDVNTGWVFVIAIRNNAHKHMLAALAAAEQAIPFPIAGLDSDNGSEFLNHQVIGWAAERDIFFTRARPHKKNDQATVESKNNHAVRRYGLYWRYDTPTELTLPNTLWKLVCDRLNYFTPTKKPIGWDTDSAGRRRRVYDTPATPIDRLIRSGVLSPDQQKDLLDYRDHLDLLDLGKLIDHTQRQLAKHAAIKTRRLQQSLKPRLPDPAGIHPITNNETGKQL
jgi:transposase InsO family protein